MKEYLIEELPERDAGKIKLAVDNWREVGSKKYPKTKQLRIPIIGGGNMFTFDGDLFVWYVYDLETNKIYLEE